MNYIYVRCGKGLYTESIFTLFFRGPKFAFKDVKVVSAESLVDFEENEISVKKRLVLVLKAYEVPVFVSHTLPRDVPLMFREAGIELLDELQADKIDTDWENK